MNGIHQHWSEDGILLKKYIYKNNEMDGLQQEWFTDGKPGAQWNYKNGEMHGRHVEWYHNGFKKLQGTRNKNSMDGTWTYWYENAQKRGVRTILNKKLVGLNKIANFKFNRKLDYFDINLTSEYELVGIDPNYELNLGVSTKF